MRLSSAQRFIGFSCYFASIVFACVPLAAYASENIKQSVKTQLNDVVFSDADGRPQRINFKNYRLTAIHLWATWCKPCIQELPKVNAAQKKFAGNGFKVITVSLDGKNYEKVARFYLENQIDSLNMLFDPNMAAFQKMNIRGLPTTIFVDSQKYEVARSEHAIDWESKESEDFILSQIAGANN